MGNIVIYCIFFMIIVIRCICLCRKVGIFVFILIFKMFLKATGVFLVIRVFCLGCLSSEIFYEGTISCMGNYKALLLQLISHLDNQIVLDLRCIPLLLHHLLLKSKPFLNPHYLYLLELAKH